MVKDDRSLERAPHRPRYKVSDCMCQIIIGRQSDSVSESLRLQILVDRRIGERRVTPEIPLKITIAISGDDGLQDDFPILGAMHVPFSEQASFEVAEVVETEKGMIAGVSKMIYS